MLLTQKAIEKLKPAGKRLQIMDDSLTGFGLRIETDGRKSFFWTARIRGNLRFRFLGEYPLVTLKQAQDAAQTLKGQASTWKTEGYQGPDPFETKPRIKSEPAGVPTFKQLVDAYIERHVRPNANTPETAIYGVNWQVKRHFQKWSEWKIDQITLPHVLAVKNACGEKHYLANRAMEFLKAIFNWSAKNREGKINFWPLENPAKDVELYDEEKRERFLQPDEMVRFEDILEEESHQDLKDFLVLSLATGARKGDVFAMKWSDIQWERSSWCVPSTTKNGKPYDASLEPVALAVLQRRRKEAPDSEKWVFPGVGKSGHVKDLKKPWQEFRKRASIADVHVHDIRRTVGSYQAIAGESLQKIAATLGQKSLQSTLVYAKLQDQAVRDAKATGKAKMKQMMKDAKKRLKIPATKRKLLKSATA